MQRLNPSPTRYERKRTHPSFLASDAHTRFHWRRALIVSLILLIPCFWQSRIQSIDLCSHIYNAWLASLIAHNQAPGLSIVQQSNNVLFDLMLAWLFRLFGAAAAQRIAVSVCVLIFGWGAILLICRGRPRNWWFLLPTVLALSYGFVFHAGFFNFYLGLGLCLLYLAIFVSGRWRLRLLSTPLLLLAWIAHPLPVLWAIGLAVFVAISELCRPAGRAILLVIGVLALVAVRYLISENYLTAWMWDQVSFANGAKHLVLFGSFYWIPYYLYLAGWTMLFCRRVVACGWGACWLDMGFQLWFLTALATLLIPTEILIPEYSTSISFISFRFSLMTGIMLGLFLIEIQPRRYEKAILAAAALIFFVLVFRDSWELNRMEDGLDAAISQLPANSRVIGRLRIPSADLSPGEHQVDRACIGHCFSYANYEPSTGQFRIRASYDNRIVMSEYQDVLAVEKGDYRVDPGDLPAYLVYLCGLHKVQICARELHTGEQVGTIGQFAGP